jgi:hypothetical protein
MIKVEIYLQEENGEYLQQESDGQSLKESCARTWGKFFRGYKEIKDDPLIKIADEMIKIADEMIKNNPALKEYVNRAELDSIKASLMTTKNVGTNTSNVTKIPTRLQPQTQR